ncbi:MAG: hypothetical protein ABEJ02_04765 [Candidatus Paceibacteria bacterium]
MYLLLDPTDNDKLELSLFSREGLVRSSSFEAKAEGFLQVIDNFLSSNNCSVSEIEGMVVVVGEGRFTATRIATTIANTFSFVENINLLAVDKTKDDLNTDNVQHLYNLIDQAEKGQARYISAQYSGKPNIN